MASLPWSTNQQTGVAVVPWNGDIPPYCTISATTPPPEATKAIQQLAGPDGVKYWVFTYILIVQPTSGATTGNYVKQVTVTVRDSRDKTKILARQTSLFDPLMG